MRGGEANGFGGRRGAARENVGALDNVGRICYNKSAIFRKDVPRPAQSKGKVFSEGRGKGRKMKRTAFFSMIFGAIWIVLCNFSGCLGELLFSIKPWEREKMYDYYTQDENYFAVWGKLETYEEFDDGRAMWIIDLDESCISALEEAGKMDFFGRKTTVDFMIVGKSQEILKKSGFYDCFEDAAARSAPTIKILQSPKIWFDGWGPVLVSAKAERIVYLDYERGKENLLNWIRNDLH